MPPKKKSTENASKTPEQLEQENRTLRSELDEIKKMLATLTKQEPKVEKKPTLKPKEPVMDESVAEVEIRPNKYIKVISLTSGILVLTTQPFGQGKEFRFNKFGEVKNIVYSELADILHCHQSFAEKGRFYVLDKNVVYNHGLVDHYKKLLTKETIDNLLEYNREEMVELFKNATTEQQESIANILLEKITNEEEVDLNKVDAISRIYGKNIIEMAEEAKSLLAG